MNVDHAFLKKKLIYKNYKQILNNSNIDNISIHTYIKMK